MMDLESFKKLSLLRNCAKVLDREDLYALFNIPEDFEYER